MNWTKIAAYVAGVLTIAGAAVLVKVVGIDPMYGLLLAGLGGHISGMPRPELGKP